MSRAYTFWGAHAILEHYTEQALATSATTLPRAIAVAETRLNRAARRALGARGDGRYHPLAALKAIPRGR